MYIVFDVFLHNNVIMYYEYPREDNPIISRVHKQSVIESDLIEFNKDTHKSDHRSPHHDLPTDTGRAFNSFFISENVGLSSGFSCQHEFMME